MPLRTIPEFPIFAEPTLEMKNEVDALLVPLNNGASELSFLNIYLFRHTYHYTISSKGNMLVIKGSYNDESFVITPCRTFYPEVMVQFLNEGFRWSCITEEFLTENKNVIAQSELKDFVIAEDRNNFDYVYLANSLATLEGKELHKKKTHINKFERTYPNLRLLPLKPSTASDAFKILQQWREGRSEDADYQEAKEVLTFLDDERFCMKGVVLYVGETAVAWSIAEIFKERKMAVVLFEKALDKYKGSFQYINYALALHLKDEVKFINREQDLGNEGLRQAKMTYRPAFFVKKYTTRIS